MEEMTAITEPEERSPREVWRDPRCLLAFGFGSGLSPAAPGTVGTLAAIPLYLVLEPLGVGAYLLIMALVFVIGISLCTHAAKVLGVHDHPAIVWDEFAGYLLTMTAAPAGWQWPLIGFVLFRFFDIVKPWPIGWVDRRVSGGFGIMIDDILAAVPAWFLLQGAARILG
ncbi:phosphatidylglycerophosphatase A [Thiohalomonas denitrificans]|uniref:Phosphatidylglycerophosphatase A n=2 Tax=Thiohalomonas denitrificans TaxID=415747 RepID=A0A1G5PZV1_9GAMM|nr:phosphatidylglycerophosphatase A [Thiohalomonas denitrificans]